MKFKPWQGKKGNPPPKRIYIQGLGSVSAYIEDGDPLNYWEPFRVQIIDKCPASSRISQDKIASLRESIKTELQTIIAQAEEGESIENFNDLFACIQEIGKVAIKTGQNSHCTEHTAPFGASRGKSQLEAV